MEPACDYRSGSITVTLVNGTPVAVESGPIPIGPHPLTGTPEWEYIVNAGSSPSKLTLIMHFENRSSETLTIKASPHCNKE